MSNVNIITICFIILYVYRDCWARDFPVITVQQLRGLLETDHKIMIKLETACHINHNFSTGNSDLHPAFCKH